MSEEVSSKTKSFEQGDIGRGYLWITGAKLWFLVTATLLNIGLPRLLGDPALFGMYKVVAGFLAVISMVILSGSLQTASKAISEAPEQAGNTRRRAQRLAFSLSGALAIIMFLGADLIARHLWQDPSLAAPLRVASVIVAGYGLYATWIGVANGLKRYRTQALFDIGFATLKTASIIALVVLGYGVLGVFGAFAGVTVLMTCAAFWVIARSTPLTPAPGEDAPREGGLAGRRMMFFMFGVMGFNLTLNLLLQGDVVLLKGLVHGLTERSVLGDGDGMVQKLLPMMTGGHNHDLSQTVQSSTSALTGVYGAVRTVTMIPYQGIISLTFVVFPLLSEATFHADREKTERTVRGALRFSVLLVGFLCGGLVLTDNVLIGILFGAPYQGGAIFLIPMVAGTVSFALYVVITSLLTAAGHPGRVLVIGSICAVIHVGLFVFATRLGQTQYEAAVFCAWATALGPLIGFLLASASLKKTLAVQLPIMCFVRGLGGSALGALMIRFVLPEVSLVKVALRLVLFVIVVLGIWLLTGEINREDRQTVRRLLSRSGGTQK